MIEAAMIVNLFVLVLTVGFATAVVAQERNPGGRLNNGGRINTERAPEGTRERPVQKPLPEQVRSIDNTSTQSGRSPTRPMPVSVETSTATCGGFVEERRMQPAFYSSVMLMDCRRNPDSAGFSFAGLRIMRFTDESVDMYYENRNGDYTMGVYHDTDIQDLGSTNSLFEFPVAPAYGWQREKEITLWERHMYSVRTRDGRYLKFRVQRVDAGSVV